MSTKSTNFCKLFKILLFIFSLVFIGGGKRVYAQYYPVHATVQWPSPQSPYLSDYYNGSRDRLIVTLYNRDLQQAQIFAKLRIKIKSPGFLATSREELSYPMLELNANVPTRLSNIDLSSYLQPENLNTSGSLRNGQLPVGYTEFSVQVVDYYTGRVLSDWHTGRSYLDVKKPPILNYPDKDAQIGITEPLYIRFQWMPRHQGLSGTEYEFVLKELPDNGASPQSAFSYGNEIYRVRTRSTTLNYTHLEPILFPNRRYAWQVQAIARDGVDEIGMFENGGFSEISHFYLNDNCKAPTGLKSRPRFGKVDLSWNKVIGTSGYVLECRPKSTLNIYEWSSTRLSGESLTLAKLKAGWSYEWRVGTLCTSDRPVFSSVREFTLSKHNDELLADCGKEPVRSDLSQVPNLGIKAGDIITIGGDYPMTIIEAVSLGDGWYSGRGKTRLRTIIDAPVSLRFDRLRINVDKFQIDGTVEATFDDNKAKISDLDYIDDGGKDIKPATIRIREHKTDFSLPSNPEFSYNPNTGELETTDAEGNPQTIKIEVPENASYESIFPMIVTDNKGSSYEISPAEQNTDTVNDEEKLNKDKNLSLNSKRIERIGDFNTESLSKKYGFIHFERGAGKYAFDSGKEKWYKNSVKLDRFYKPFAKDYIAGWKLIPSGEKDIVIARYDGDKNIDLKKVRFASEPNSVSLPASLNETDKTWTLSLGSVSPGTSYDVYALYDGEVIGKLRVLSYAKQNHKLTIVPINEVELDKDAIERSLNSIYNTVGVNFTVGIDDRMRGNYDWEVDSEKDGLLSTVGKSFWGYDKELKESTEMLNLQKTYEQVAGTLDGAYLFVLNGATGLEGLKDGLLGEMPRKSRFGYIFAGNSPNIDALSRTIAHELGHGLFTLQHIFDYEYAGEKTKATTKNLMDYAPNGKDLAAFQWNIMANPALFTAGDKAEEGKLELKNNQYLGFAPNGKVIPVHSGSRKFTRIENTYIIKSLIDDDGTIYNWNEDSFVAENGSNYPLIENPLSGEVAIWRTSKNPLCYVWYKFIKVQNYTSDQFAQIKKSISQDDGTGWNLAYVAGAPEDCKSFVEIEKENLSHLRSSIYFTENASLSRLSIISELAEFFPTNGTNTFTQKELSTDRVIIISIEGDSANEIEKLKSKSEEYIHIIFSNEDGYIKLSRIETTNKFRDKLLHIWGLIKSEPWASQAIILYEIADLLDKGIEYLKIPEHIWSCNNESNTYKKVIAYLLDSEFPILRANSFISNKLNEESKFAFVCGVWNGTVDIVQSVPDLVKLLTCAFHPNCVESVSSQWNSFKNAVIEDDSANILCGQDQYFCKAKYLIGVALEDLVADDCKIAHTVGSVVGPIAVLCMGDVVAVEPIIARLGAVGSGLNYAIKGLQLCDKITDITRPLAKGLKVTTALVKKSGKLLPQIRINGKTVLHYVGDKLHLRKFDAVTKKAIDEPVEESNLSQKIKEYIDVDIPTTTIDKFRNLLSSNADFRNVLKDIRIKGKSIEVDKFVEVFEKLYKEAPTNSLKSIDEVMDDFLYLIDNHLSDFMKTSNKQKQITYFLNQLLESKHKFKAGATTLEVIHNAQKYIPSKYYKTLSNIELEDFISSKKKTSKFRFDIKWKAINETGERISIYVDTKNYSKASNMFNNLDQFKAYLEAIYNFDELYIIQQGGRGVTREQIINSLINKLNKGNNKYEVFEIIWDNEKLRNNVFQGFSYKKALEKFNKNINDNNYELFNSILITK